MMRCSDIRGFNYSGSWGTSALDLWQHHDQGTMAVEIARGKRYFPAWNVCRWWLGQESFQRDAERFLANFAAGLRVFAEHKILVIPVLFNRWRTPVCDFGGVCLEHLMPGMGMGVAENPFAYWQAPAEWPRESWIIERTHLAYLEAVVGEHRNDARIMTWDLCNEPLLCAYAQDPASPARAAELQWLAWCYRTCKRLGAAQPLTIGNPGLDAVRLTEPISDILSFHPYYIWCDPAADPAAYEKSLDQVTAFAESVGKELLASEAVWGATDDEKHVEVMRYTLGELRQRRIGFLVHALQHSLVADLHYPAYGPVGSPQVMHFVNPDGSLRKGHEAFNEF